MAILEQVSRSEWSDWKNSRITKGVVESIFNTREELKEGLAEGQASTDRELCILIGRCQGLADSIDFIMKHKVEEIDDVESGSAQDNG